MTRRLVLLAVLAGVLAGAVVAVAVPTVRDRPAAAGAAVAPAVRAADDPGAPRPAPTGDPRRPLPGPALLAPRGGGYVEVRPAGPVRLEDRAADPRGGPPFAVRTFAALRVVGRGARRRGVDPVIGRVRCAELGRVAGGRFGWIDGANRFRPTPPGAGAAPRWCGSRTADLRRRPHLQVVTRITDPARGAAAPLQTVAWGIAGPAGRVALRLAGRPVAVPRTPSGVFVAVAAPDVRAADVGGAVAYPAGRPVPIGDGELRVQARRLEAELRGFGRGAPTGALGRTRLRLPRPGARPVVEARTPDPHGGLPWGVAAVPAEGGGACTTSMARIVGDRVGGVDFTLGTFTDAGIDPNGGCPGGPNSTPSRRRPLALSYGYGGGLAGEPGQDPLAGRVARRTLRGLSSYVGRAHPDVVRITIATPRDVRTLLPSRRARAFLAVYDGEFPTGEVVLTATFRDGSTHREVIPSTAF